MMLSATAEAVGIDSALQMRRTWTQRTYGLREAFCSCSEPREASDGEPVLPEAHSVLADMVDGLRATSLISSRRPVAIW